MQQRQLRLGDILDDYCPRERRLTNHAVVAMVGPDVKQTRCTTCDAEHEYKHAKMPRLKKKDDLAMPQAFPGGPRRVPPDGAAGIPSEGDAAADASVQSEHDAEAPLETPLAASEPGDAGDDSEPLAPPADEGPVHRPLIRATLPKHEGQAPPTRPAPDFTIRQPAGRPSRFRGRNQQQRPSQTFNGYRSGGNPGGGTGRGPNARPQGGRPHDSLSSRPPRRQDAGRKRSK